MILKRVSKYTIKESNKLYTFCDEQSFKAKNLRNLSNYHIRQCFVLSSKELLNKEQKLYLKKINNAIFKYNAEKRELFYSSKPSKIEKKIAEIDNFKLNPSIKGYNAKLEKLISSLNKLKASEFKPQKYITKGNGLFSYDFLNYYFSRYLRSQDNPYKELAAQTSQQVMRNLFKDWKGYFAFAKDYKKNKSKYTGRPKLPKYKKKNGRCKLSFTNQSCKVRDNSHVTLPMTDLILTLGIDCTNLTLKEVRIVPTGNVYKMEVVWDKEINIEVKLDENNYISIDLGLNNLAAITNNIGLKPIIVNGKPLKSVNQYYNKQLAFLKSRMPFRTVSRYDKKKGVFELKKEQLNFSRKIEKLTLKRNAKIEDYMHKTSAYIIKYCVENNIGNIIIGNNETWKSQINLGVKNNQNFVQIPFKKLIDMLTYKAEVFGIKVILTEESYTSKACFINLDTIPVLNENSDSNNVFSGKRINRGLYKTGDIVINADINGSYNIMRKIIGETFSEDFVASLKYIPTIVDIGGYCKKKPV